MNKDKVKEIMELFKDKKCNCPLTTCEQHGNCVECVTVHRHFKNHLPHCLQFLVSEKVKELAKIAEMKVDDKKNTKHQVALEKVRQKNHQCIVQMLLTNRLLKKSNFGLFQAKKIYSIPQFAAKLWDSRLFKVHYKTIHGFCRIYIAKSMSSFIVFQQPANAFSQCR